MTHFVRVASVYFFNSYKDYIDNQKYREKTYDEKFLLNEEAIQNMDDIIHEICYIRMLSGKLNYFKIVESYKLMEDENDEQE